MKTLLPLLFASLALFKGSIVDPPEGIGFFEKKIRPVLVDKCDSSGSAVLERAPKTNELTDALTFLKSFTATTNSSQPHAALCQRLFASAEFRYLYVTSPL